MKKVLIAVIIAIAISGCAAKKAAQVKESPKVAFPVELAGTWVGEVINVPKWQITIKPDGTIESFRNYWNVFFKVADGGASEEGQEGAVAAYTLGPTSVHYDPNGRKLEVSIAMDNYYISLPIGEAEGDALDVIKGVVSEDNTTWKAQWWQYGHLKGAQKADPNKVPAEEIIFKKVETEDTADTKNNG